MIREISVEEIKNCLAYVDSRKERIELMANELHKDWKPQIKTLGLNPQDLILEVDLYRSNGKNIGEATKLVGISRYQYHYWKKKT